MRNTLMLNCRVSMGLAYDWAITDAFQFGDEGSLRCAANSQIRFTESLRRLDALA